MERKNLVLLPSPYYLQQIPIPPPCFYYQCPQYQPPKQSHYLTGFPQYPPSQIIPFGMPSVYSSSKYGHDNHKGEYMEIQQTNQNSFQVNESPHHVQTTRSEIINKNENEEDELYNQITHNTHQVNQDSMRRQRYENKANNNPLISAPIIFQEDSNKVWIAEEKQQIQKQEQAQRDNNSSTDKISLNSCQKKKKKLVAHWREISFKREYETSMRILINSSVKSLQPFLRKKKEQQINVKIQPDESDKMRQPNSKFIDSLLLDKLQIYRKKYKTTDYSQKVTFQNSFSLFSSISNLFQSLLFIFLHRIEDKTILKKYPNDDIVSEEDEIINEEVAQNSKNSSSNLRARESEDYEQALNGNICKNLMRAFNKFIQNYDFKDQSIKVSLFRFLERNTYSNLQMLKIYHNPRYRSIFLEFVKGGALLWLQQSRVIDINSHINLLEKIVEGDVSKIGIKKRKNVSKLITTNIKKKSLPKKKI